MLSGTISANSKVASLMLPIPFAWYAADYLDLDDGDQVEVWPDKGPNGLNLVKTSPLGAPVFRANATPSGLPAVEYEVGLSRIVSSFSIQAQPNTVIVAWRSNADTGTVFQSSGAGASSQLTLRNNELHINAGQFLLYPKVAPFGFIITTAIFNGTNSAIRENGEVKVIGNAGTNGIASLNVGSRSNQTEQLDGHIAEFIFYNRLLTPSEIEDVERYLYEKYLVIRLSGRIDAISTVKEVVEAIALSGTITGESDLAGAFKMSHVLSGTIEAESELTIELTMATALSGTSAGEAVLSGHITMEMALSASSEATAELNAKISRRIAISGSVSAEAALSAKLTLAMAITGTVPGNSDLTASLGLATHITGSISGQPILIAHLSQLMTLSGSSHGQSVPDAYISRDISISGTIAGKSDLAAVVHLAMALAGNVEVASDVSGTLEQPFIGTIAATSALAGALRLSAKIAGQIEAESILQAYLEKLVRLFGFIAGQSNLQAHLSVALSPAGEITGQSALSAGLILVMSLQGTIEGSSALQADLVALTLLSGQVDAASVLQADLTRLLQITGAIFGQSVLTASIEVHRGLGGAIVAVSMLHAELTGGALIGVTLFGQVDREIHLEGEAKSMARTGQNFELYQGESKEVYVYVQSQWGGHYDLTGASVRWRMQYQALDPVPPFLEKSSGSGITIPNPAQGLIKIDLEPQDTEVLPGGFYHHQVEVTEQDGTISLVTEGRVKLNPRVFS